MLAVSAEEGSLASRFGNGIVKLNALRDRASGALSTTRRRLEAHDSQLRRRLHANAAHADALYEALERSHADVAARAARARAAREPRAQLGARASRIRTPRTRARARARARPISAHPRPVQELVDWDPRLRRGLAAVRHRARAAQAARDGHAARRDRASSTPRGTTTSTTRTTRAPRSLGDAVRRVLYRKETGADPPWHEPTVLHRVQPAHERAARWRRGPGSHLRRLGVAFFEATIAAPFSFVDSLMPSGVTVEKRARSPSGRPRCGTS